MTLLHHLLEASAREGADRVAVDDPDRGARITYGELDAQAGALAGVLADAGVAAGERVGLCAPKSIGTVAALFGALKAGGAYVPVDASAPPPRNAFIFRDCGVRALVVDRARVEGLQAEYADAALTPVAELEALRPYGADLVVLRAPEAAAAPTTPPDGLSYILYTSGSTGQPKGVMHTHASALSFVDWCSSVFEPTDRDAFSSHAPFHFDLSILDLYVPLKHGARLVLLSESLGKQPQPLARAIAETGITAWYSTPSVLRLLVEFGGLEAYDYSALRIVNFAGEVFPVKHLRALKGAWPHPRYFNLYGPTETNVCTFFEVPSHVPDDRTDPYPIGIACSGDRTLVADEHDRPLPAGTPGELYVAGGSVMQGYWNLPDRNARAFFVDDGERWYRTGDIVVDTGDGVYDFVGRRDRMVKRRGYRVELGEIEAALYGHPDVSEAAVVALPDEESGVRIKAFLGWTGGAPSLIAMKQFCAKNLPLYMIPDQFAFEDALPKTSTDKIDYQRLQARA